MFIIYECATCVFVALIGATLLFTACVMLLVLVEAGSILTRRARKLSRKGIRLKGSWVAAESRDSQL
jgi:cation transport ATPase